MDKGRSFTVHERVAALKSQTRLRSGSVLLVSIETSLRVVK